MSYVNFIFFPQEYINIYYYYNTTSVILYENQNVLHVAKLSSFLYLCKTISEKGCLSLYNIVFQVKILLFCLYQVTVLYTLPSAKMPQRFWQNTKPLCNFPKNIVHDPAADPPESWKKQVRDKKR